MQSLKAIPAMKFCWIWAEQFRLRTVRQTSMEALCMRNATRKS